MKEAQKKEGSVGPLTRALGIKTREVISLVGAGGKTTLMFRLVQELLRGEKKVVTTTTTRIFEPLRQETERLFIDPDEEKIKDFLRRELKQYRHITVATERLESGKLKGISPNSVNGLWGLQEVDAIIVEADGAAGRPVKAPRENEPVIPASTTLVVAILGVDALGKKLDDENVFQPERVSKMTGIPVGGRVTDEAMAALITHPEGIFRGAPVLSRVAAFLNKVDIPDGVTKAKRIAQKILDRKHQKIERVVLAQLKSEPPVMEVIFP